MPEIPYNSLFMLNFGFDESGNCPELVNRATRIWNKYPNIRRYTNFNVSGLFDRIMAGDYPGVLFSLVCGCIETIAERRKTNIEELDNNIKTLFISGKLYRTAEMNPYHQQKQPDWENYLATISALDIYSMIGFVSVIIDQTNLIDRSGPPDKQVEEISFLFRRYMCDTDESQICEIWKQSAHATGEAIDTFISEYPKLTQDLIKSANEYIALVLKFVEDNNSTPDKLELGGKTLGEQFSYSCFAMWGALGIGLLSYEDSRPFTDMYYKILHQLDKLMQWHNRDIQRENGFFKPDDFTLCNN